MPQATRGLEALAFQIRQENGRCGSESDTAYVCTHLLQECVRK